MKEVFRIFLRDSIKLVWGVVALAVSILLSAAEETNMDAKYMDEGQFVEINGLKQWLVVRGKKSANPVLLLLSGPGVALSSIAPFFEAWEESFTLVFWDQPGSGATHGANPGAQGELSLDRFASDGIAVTDYLRDKLQVDKIVVLGISAGSMVGLKMMQLTPGHYSAYVGTGQFIDWAEQEELSYKLLLDKAQAESNEEMEKVLLDIGPPPYGDAATDGVKSTYHSALTAAEMQEFPVFSGLMTEALTNPPADASYIAEGITLANPRELAMSVYSTLRPELMAFDAREMSMSYAMPLFFIQGSDDCYSITSVVETFAADVSAPAKSVIIIEDGSHSVFWLRDKFLAALEQSLLPVLQ